MFFYVSFFQKYFSIASLAFLSLNVVLCIREKCSYTDKLKPGGFYVSREISKVISNSFYVFTKQQPSLSQCYTPLFKRVTYIFIVHFFSSTVILYINKIIKFIVLTPGSINKIYEKWKNKYLF